MEAAQYAMSEEDIATVLAHPDADDKRTYYHNLLTTSFRPLQTLLYKEARHFAKLARSRREADAKLALSWREADAMLARSWREAGAKLARSCALVRSWRKAGVKQSWCEAGAKLARSIFD